MDEKFYLRFEDLHRGDTKRLLDKFQVYEPVISLICQETDDAKFLDLGCGKGEFLSFISACGGDTIGVEKNSVNRNSIKKNDKIIFEHDDALSWLKSQKDSSFDFVSAMHVIEHLDFPYLYELVGEIKRVLKKEGIMLFETPNPDNLTVATKNFYTDPTHLRLVPVNLASFIIQDHGFSRAYSWGVNESPNIGKSPCLNDVLGGASPDYAIFGLVTRSAFEGKLDKILQLSRGRSTKQICDLFEQRYQNDYSIVLEELKKIECKIVEQNCYYRDQIFESNRELNKEIIRLRHTLESELNSIYQSKSWRVTAPLRVLAKFLRGATKIILNALVSFKNNSKRDFFTIYSHKFRRFFENLLSDSDGKNWNHINSKKGAFFDKYKRILDKAVRKKK